MPHEVLYEERLSSLRTQALFVSLTALFSVGFGWRMAKTGWNPLGVVLLIAAAFFLFYSLSFRTLVIRLTADALRLRFGLLTWTVPLDDVGECRLDDLPAFMRYGGAGVHFMSVRGRYRVSFNFLEYPRVVVSLERPGVVRDVSFSTRHPDEVIRLLDTARPTTR